MTDRVEVNPNVLFGKPGISGTDIRVALLLRKLSDGMPSGFNTRSRRAT
jgi:uncharacterized protein (DUF433 family)